MLPRSRSRRWTSSMVCLAALAFVAGPTHARQQPPAAEAARDDAMVVLPDGRRLHLTCSGNGAPTVILDAGLGLDSSVWMRVKPGLSSMARTCAYDRAGYGQSDPGPQPRDSARRASDLLDLMEATVEAGPFVLVAHSAADIPARLLAGRRPDLIAGLVLVDPGADLATLRAAGPVWAAGHDAGWSAALTCIRATAAGEMRPENAIYAECGSPPLEGPLASREMAAAVLSESEAGADEDGISADPGGLDIPLVVLTAEDKFAPGDGAGPGETEPLRRAWFEAGATIAASSSRGEQRMVPGASHVIQFERPQAVIDAVADVVEGARSRNGRQAPVR